jgi:ABC-type Fe3+-hydroxamate transport system substrate-binding protein
MARLCPAMESDQSMKQAAAIAAAARREREAQALRANLARRKAQLRARDAGVADPPTTSVGADRDKGAGQPCR